MAQKKKYPHFWLADAHAHASNSALEEALGANPKDTRPVNRLARSRGPRTMPGPKRKRTNLSVLFQGGHSLQTSAGGSGY